MPNRQKGFTLVELIVVMVILGIALTFAIPDMNSWLFNTIYRDSAQEVLQVLRQARSLAVANNLEQRAEFDLTNQRYRLAQGNRPASSTAWTTPPWIAMANSVSLRGKDAIDAIDDCSDGNDINFVFRPNGTAEIQPAVVPVTLAEITASGFLCIMDANNLAEPARFIVEVQHNDTAVPIISNTGRAFIQ